MNSETATDVTLRPATVDDTDSLYQMIKAMSLEMNMGDRVRSCADSFRRFGFCEPPLFETVIAERGNRVIGMCLYLFSYSSWRGTRGVYVQDIFITKSERGSGLARSLMAEAARRAGAQGAEFLRLSVARDNLAARKFYQDLGLKHADEECIYMALDDDFEALKKA